MNEFAVAEVFRRIDREVWLVTSAAGASRGGLIATFVSQASIAPDAPRVLIGLARRHHTRRLIEAGGGFALHLLGETHLDWVWRFGLQTGHEVDKFDGFEFQTGVSGAPIVSGTLGFLDCRAEARLETGDRTVYLGEVIDARSPGPAPLLTVHRLLDLAPEDRRRALRDQLDRDAAIDLEAIRDWRRSR